MTERQLADLFTAGCDPYEVAARVLFGTIEDAASQDARDLIKRVFMHVAAHRGEAMTGKIESTLRRATALFHEVGSAIAAEDLLPNCCNEVLAGKLRENLRSHDQIKRIMADGFELCVLALAALGETDVTIHECGDRELEEW